MRRRGLVRGLLASALLFWLQPGTAANLVFESQQAQTIVLELYTSHGCSSCPPADAWLRRLTDHPQLWQGLIPLSFHVDYWDYLGWKDRFARPAFSQRQRNYRLSGALRTVYTPGLLLNGEEWRGWLRHASPELTSGEHTGRLKLELEADGTALLTFDPQQTPHRPEAYLAVLGFGLATPIGGGENAGKRLREDFVVLGMSRGTPDPDARLRWRLPRPEMANATPERLAVVAWVSAAGNPRPVQAVAGWLP